MADSILDIWSLRRRGKLDHNRHSERIKKAIKDNLRELVSDSSIISSDGKRKVKIPIRYLDNYRFRHADDKNREGVGQGDKKHKPGDPIAHDGTGKGQGSGKAGEEAGEEVYEEITMDEIVNMMLEDLGLPWLEKKETVVEVETEDIVFNDISEIGPLSNVDKKKTIYENMKRNAKNGKAVINKISPDDLRYKIYDIKKEFHSNAAVYFLMDRSGSMDEERRYLSKSFFFWMAHFCKTRYSNVDLVFIAHDTEAHIVPEENFFKISNSGGTKCSSAFKLALEDINKNHPPSVWNNYVFEFSDGDNWGDDNNLCVGLVEDLLKVCCAVGYGEIVLDSSYSNWSSSSLSKELSNAILNQRFLTSVIKKKEDIYDCLRDFLKIRKDGK